MIITKQKLLVVHPSDHRADHRADSTHLATAVSEDRAVATRMARLVAVRLEGPITVAATLVAVPLAVIALHPAAAVLVPCITATMKTIRPECQ